MIRTAFSTAVRCGGGRHFFLFAALCLFLAAPPAVSAGERIIKVSGDCQSGLSGRPLKEDFRVRVLGEDGRPVSGRTVFFSIEGARAVQESSLSATQALTDLDGYASTRLMFGTGAHDRLEVGAATEASENDPVQFNVMAQTRRGLLMTILEVLGGLGLFLFGMFFINDGLQKAAGDKLRELLLQLTSSGYRGIGTGFLITLFNQSSSATTLLEVSLVSAGILTFYQTMAVTMGAEIGSTITAQLIAFRLSDYSVFIAGAGFYISVLARSRIWKHAGDIILGLGIVFLGLGVMSDAVAFLRYQGEFLDFMRSAQNPLLGILVGLLFTLAVHSSAVTVGIVIALALAGTITLQQAVPINLGAQVGTCFTVWLGAIGRGREGQRTVLWHVVHQTAGVVLIYPFLTVFTCHGDAAWIYFVKWFTRTFFGTIDPARQIAMAHTLAAVVNAFVFLPFLPVMNRLMRMLLPAREEEKPFGPVYIDRTFLSNTPFALEQSRKEVVREGEIVLEMMRNSLRVFDLQDIKLAETVSLMDIRVDVLRNSIVPYLTLIGQGALSEEQSALETRLLLITVDLEAIGDIIDKNIVPLARKKIEHKLWFSDEGWNDIVDLFIRVTANLEQMVDALRNGNLELAKFVAKSKSYINKYESELRIRHIGRLHSGLQEALETSNVHLDLIDNLKRINSHIASVGRTMQGQV